MGAYPTNNDFWGQLLALRGLLGLIGVPGLLWGGSVGTVES